ncbi:MAG: MFS transporter [Chloroflexota bacterium]|nr:MFS transporter [Chloroflexota bacterium]
MTASRHEADGLWKRNLYVIWAANFLSIASFSFVFPFMPLFIQQLGVPDPGQAALWTGIAAGASGLALFISGPIWGMIGDRYGRKRNLLRALFGSAVAVALTGLAGDVYQLLLFRLLVGAVSGTVPAAMALVASQTPRHKVGYTMGILQTSMYAGSVLGPFIGGYLAQAAGFRNAFFFAGGALAVSGVVTWWLAKEEFRPSPQEVTATPVAHLKRFYATVKTPELLSVLAVMFLVQLGPVITFPVLPLFLKELSGQETTASLTGTAFALMGVSGLVASFLVARLSQRIGLKVVLVSGAALAGVFYLPMLLVSGPYQAIGVVTVVGIFNGAMMSTVTGLLAEAVPREKQGQAFGASQSAFSLAFGLGPLAGGALATVIGLRLVFLANGLVMFVVALVTWRTISVRRADALPVPQPSATTKVG